MDTIKDFFQLYILIFLRRLIQVLFLIYTNDLTGKALAIHTMCYLFLSYIPRNFYYAPIKTWLQILCFLIIYECMLNRKNASNVEING